MNKIMFKIMCLVVFLVLSIPFVSAESMKYCKGNDLYLVTDMSLNISNTIFPIRNLEIVNCQFGCSNSTLINLGYPGCIESDLLIAIIFMVGIFVAVFIIKKVAG